MTEKSKVSRTKLSRSQLQDLIREESKLSQNVVFTQHMRQRMRERAITNDMVMDTLHKGRITRTPEPNSMYGTLECRMEHYVAGIGVGIIVAVSDEDPTLILVTAIDI
jgi:hypothetical protein